MTEPKEQIYLREDIHQLSQQLTQQSHNVISHKRIKKSNCINNHKNLFGLEDTDCKIQRQQTDLIELISLKQDIKNITEATDSDNFIKGQKKIQTLQTYCLFKQRDNEKQLKNKMNQTMTVKTMSKESRRSDFRMKKSHSIDVQTKIQIKKKKLTLAKDIEKQFNKGPLKEKHLMNWLNQILIQYCFQLQFQKGMLKALQRFGLDNNTLISRGVKTSNVFRLYQSLFVYSIGFNSLLKDISSNRSVMKSIWKVYAVLLQYCSQGNFQTIMGELQRDMIETETKLKKQIQKRQNQIDRNQQIMEQRLSKYTKQNKQLRETVKNLVDKNNMLQKQFRQMEVGFNMEVSLRLAYQYKINGIYSVHQKLNIVHLNLYRQFQQKNQQNKKLNKDVWAAKQKMIEFKTLNEELNRTMKELLNIKHSDDTLIEGLELNATQLQQKLMKQINIKRQELIDARDKDRKIQQMQRELDSCNLMIKMMNEASHSQIEQYRRVMNENMELRLNNQAQVTKIVEVLNQIKDLNLKESTMLSVLNYNNIKMNQQNTTIKSLEVKIEELSQHLQDRTVELTTKNSQIDSMAKLLASMDSNMKNLKLLYQKMEQDKMYFQKCSKQLSQQMEGVHKQNMEAKLKISQMKEAMFDLQLQLNRRISELLVLQKKYQADNLQQISKYQHLFKIFNGKDQKQTSLIDQLAQAKTQLEAANLRIAFLSERYTDLSFEKTKLDETYKDVLVLHERQKNNQKQLMIAISTLTDNIEKCHRQNAIANKIHQQKMKQMKFKQQKLKVKLTKLEELLKKKEGFVHPMLLEDAFQGLQREIQNHSKTTNTLENQVQKQKQKNISMSIEMQKKETDFRQNMKDLERRCDKMKEEMKSQRQYFKLKNQQLSQIVYQLQNKLNYQSLVVQKKQENQMSNQSKIMSMMKAKNFQIQQLLTQLQRIQDNFQKKCVDYQSEIKVIQKDKDEVITHLKDSKKEMEIKVAEIQKQYALKLIEKEKEKQQIIKKFRKTPIAIKQDSQQNLQAKNRIFAKNQKTSEEKRLDFSKKLKLSSMYYKK